MVDRALRERLAHRLLRPHEHDSDNRSAAAQLGRFRPGAERLDELAVDRQLAAQDAADPLSGRRLREPALAAHHVVRPRIELDVDAQLCVVDRPLGQLPAERGRTVVARAETRLVRAERRRARMERAELPRGDVDDPTAGGELELLAGREQVLVQRQRRHIPRQTYLSSSQSSTPYFEPSRPIPDSFIPPNGATSVEMIPVLTPRIPYSSASETRQTRPRSRL